MPGTSKENLSISERKRVQYMTPEVRDLYLYQQQKKKESKKKKRDKQRSQGRKRANSEPQVHMESEAFAM